MFGLNKLKEAKEKAIHPITNSKPPRGVNGPIHFD